MLFQHWLPRHEIESHAVVEHGGADAGGKTGHGSIGYHSGCGVRFDNAADRQRLQISFGSERYSLSLQGCYYLLAGCAY